MFGLEGIIWLGVTGAVSIFGYLKTRQFVRRRLRFVDAVQKPGGVGIGAGVLHGARDVKRLPSG